MARFLVRPSAVLLAASLVVGGCAGLRQDDLAVLAKSDAGISFTSRAPRFRQTAAIEDAAARAAVHCAARSQAPRIDLVDRGRPTIVGFVCERGDGAR
jgi:hypothetical protein